MQFINNTNLRDRKQLSIMSVIPEVNGSARSMGYEEDRDPIQESRDHSESGQLERGLEDVVVIRQRKPTLPSVGRMREKYSDPNRFEDIPPSPLNSPSASPIAKNPLYTEHFSANQRKFVV